MSVNLRNYQKRSFRQIVLTGPPGCGKTTLIKKVCQRLKQKDVSVTGFFTEEIRSGAERTGFDVVSLAGERYPLARIKSDINTGKHVVGKYTIDIKSFELCVLPILNSYASIVHSLFMDKNSILVVDEIGKMELYSEQFKKKISDFVSNIKGVILATVPLKAEIPFVKFIKNHNDTLLLEVNRQNRNNLEETILKYIEDAKSCV